MNSADRERVTEAQVERVRKQLADFHPSTPPNSNSRYSLSADVQASVGQRLRSLINRTTVRDVVSFHSRLIVLSSHDSIDTCLLTLQDNSISAVPVADLENRTYLGIVSAFDLAAYLASLFPSKEQAPEQMPNLELKNIVNCSKMSPFLPQPLDTSLAALMKIFCDGCFFWTL